MDRLVYNGSLGWYIIILLIAGIILSKDYAKDRGKYINAKRIHAILVILLLITFWGSVLNIFKIIANYQNYLKYASSQFLPPRLYIAWLIIKSIIGISIFTAAAAMLNRNNTARIWLIKLIAFSAVINFAFHLMKNFHVVENSNFSDYSYMASFLVAVTLILGIYVGVILTYRSKFMVQFFQRGATDNVENEKNLDEMIDDIGN
ncbi:MAG: hypothetical protein AAGI38_03470 [Bacteroidota bacterium]